LKALTKESRQKKKKKMLLNFRNLSKKEGEPEEK